MGLTMLSIIAMYLVSVLFQPVLPVFTPVLKKFEFLIVLFLHESGLTKLCTLEL